MWMVSQLFGYVGMTIYGGPYYNNGCCLFDGIITGEKKVQMTYRVSM